MEAPQKPTQTYFITKKVFRARETSNFIENLRFLFIFFVFLLGIYLSTSNPVVIATSTLVFIFLVAVMLFKFEERNLEIKKNKSLFQSELDEYTKQLELYNKYWEELRNKDKLVNQWKEKKKLELDRLNQILKNAPENSKAEVIVKSSEMNNQNTSLAEYKSRLNAITNEIKEAETAIKSEKNERLIQIWDDILTDLYNEKISVLKNIYDLSEKTNEDTERIVICREDKIPDGVPKDEFEFIFKNYAQSIYGEVIKSGTGYIIVGNKLSKLLDEEFKKMSDKYW